MRGDRPALGAEKILPLTFTPHARGSTLEALREKRGDVVYPACAGIDLLIQVRLWQVVCLPRMRGDRPWELGYYTNFWMFTPHARGSTFITTIVACCSHVYPACAGIDHGLSAVFLVIFRLPRMRGDRPRSTAVSTSAATFTPHARGSTPYPGCKPRSHHVYPACAGIDPRMNGEGSSLSSLPRMRGDRPYSSMHSFILVGFTPHARGSTFSPIPIRLSACVYPACAGIDLDLAHRLHLIKFTRMRIDTHHLNL